MWVIHIFPRVTFQASNHIRVSLVHFPNFFIYLNFSSTSFTLLLLCGQFTSFQTSPSKHQIIYVSLLSIYPFFFFYLNFSSTSFSLFLSCGLFISFQWSPSKHIFPSIKSYTCLSCPFTQFFIYLKFSSTSFSLLLLCGQFTSSQKSPPNNLSSVYLRLSIISVNG